MHIYMEMKPRLGIYFLFAHFEKLLSAKVALLLFIFCQQIISMYALQAHSCS